MSAEDSQGQVGGAEPPSRDGEGALSATTAWTRNLEAPLREFLRTEAGGAAVLLAATVAALVWANASSDSYDDVWSAVLSISFAGASVTLPLHQWINEGLMAFFFLVVGLEVRREFDLGELRERRRLLIPVAAGVGGMAVPIAIYLAFNIGHGTTRGWGAAMSTDTAFALGALALLGRRFPARLRALLLTIAVVDDLIGLMVIAVAYSSSVNFTALAVGLAALAVTVALRLRAVRNGLLYVVFAAVAWVAF